MEIKASWHENKPGRRADGLEIRDPLSNDSCYASRKEKKSGMSRVCVCWIREATLLSGGGADVLEQRLHRQCRNTRSSAGGWWMMDHVSRIGLTVRLRDKTGAEVEESIIRSIWCEYSRG